jgi:acid phosphatase (class A)
MKNRLIFILLISFSLWACHTKPVAPEATQVQSAYLERDLSSEVLSQVPAFPKPGSPEQKKDEKELLQWQKKRSAKDCERAQSEVVVTLQSLYGQPYGFLDEKQVDTLKPFFEKIRSEFGNYVGMTKKAYSRQRPYLYVKNLKPCLPQETSFAYPSGHATIAVFYGQILSDLFPDKAEQIQKRADGIALDRVIGGVHHPTDIEAGKKMGLWLYSELAKSKLYHTDVDAYRKALQTVALFGPN